MVRLGYNSNGFQSHRLEEAATWLADLGYRAIALTPDVVHLDPQHSSRAQVQEFGTLCRELDLMVVVETGARYVLDPRRKHRPNLLEGDGSDSVRLRFLQDMLEWCELLGAPVLSLWSGALPEEVGEYDAEQRLVDHLGALCEQAVRGGVRVALEPEPGHLVETVEDWRRISSRVGSALGLSLDVGHLLVTREGDLAAVAEPCLGSICNVQLDDMMPGVHQHLAPGEGEVDWVAVRHLLELLPDETPACFELSRDSHRFHELAPRLISEFSF